MVANKDARRLGGARVFWATPGGRHAERDGPLAADVWQTRRRECQDAAELGAGEAAAFGGRLQYCSLSWWLIRKRC